jgi:hypothetical protein
MSRGRVQGAQPTYGTPPATGRGVVRSYGEARPCSAPGCTTVLSRYNENERCWAHIANSRTADGSRPR